MTGALNEAANKLVELPPVATESLGDFGLWLASHHVGDLAGIAGLLVSVVGLGLTYNEARKARVASQAAKLAAQAALRTRDRLDVVSDLAELQLKLHELRDLCKGDDWSNLDPRFDAVFRLTLNISAAGASDTSAEAELSHRVMEDLRSIQISANKYKDMAKRPQIKASAFAALLLLIDEVSKIHAKRRRNEN